MTDDRIAKVQDGLFASALLTCVVAAGRNKSAEPCREYDFEQQTSVLVPDVQVDFDCRFGIPVETQQRPGERVGLCARSAAFVRKRK